MKAKKDNKKIMSVGMSIFIVVIMVMSAFAVIFYGYSDSGQNTLKYGDHKFKVTQNGYTTRIDGKDFIFNALPQEVEDINVTGDMNAMLSESSVVVVTSDPESSYVQEIAVSTFNIDNVLMNIGKYPKNAFIKPDYKLPVLSCANATVGVTIFEISYSNQTSINAANGCVNMTFDSSYNLNRVSAKAMYILLGVFDEK